MTHSVPEESISLEGGMMEEIKEIEIGNQDKNLPAATAWKHGECVFCHDKNKKIVNKRSQTCGACYQKWIKGKREHPTLGKFESSLIRSKIKPAKIKETSVKKTPDAKDRKKADDSPGEATLKNMADAAAREIVAEIKSFPATLDYTRLDAGIIIDLEKYPRIKKQVDFLTEKYFVTSEHAIIGLIGEALATRARRRDYEQD